MTPITDASESHRGISSETVVVLAEPDRHRFRAILANTLDADEESLIITAIGDLKLYVVICPEYATL